MKDRSAAAAAAAAAAVATAEDRPSSVSPTSSASSGGPYSPPAVLSPCAACKTLRRRCAEKCVLAPYFPPAEPLKFAIAHRVFGASNIIKLLQELPEDQRADAVNSMVYEANARLRDPIYGCAGAISHLQAQIGALQAELAKAQAQILNMQCQNADLADKICRETAPPSTQNVEDSLPLQTTLPYDEDSSLFFDEGSFGISWGSLWT